ncbi:hypothetical protein L7Q18_32645 [Achromobacter xylosoxidans]|uniref:hypothetical protein n=1 Tax=Alcaligenes xylosoxydans xylosoxydans TaxID=85698 RepID=UPI001F0512B9|nr:hypothetical protein [Achromobacter xylosoxidans]MCH1991019.1 hypothetical protein [Achromobacter xylosoxidans]
MDIEFEKQESGGGSCSPAVIDEASRHGEGFMNHRQQEPDSCAITQLSGPGHQKMDESIRASING